VTSIYLKNQLTDVAYCFRLIQTLIESSIHLHLEKVTLKSITSDLKAWSAQLQNGINNFGLITYFMQTMKTC